METDQKSHNQPSHEEQVKGGQHSHDDKHKKEQDQNQPSQGGNRTPPSREEPSRGGQPSHSGGNR